MGDFHETPYSCHICSDCGVFVGRIIIYCRGHVGVGLEEPDAGPVLDRTLDICDQGSFFVGGVPKVTTYATSAITEGTPQQLDIGQMYVQFQIPKRHRKWPVIMVHGGGFSGSCVEATPQGTEGWVAYSLRNDLATFVVDQAGRGRQFRYPSGKNHK